MQEETTEKTIALSIKATKLTGKVLMAAMRKLLEKQKTKVPTGKQSVKQLMGQNTGISNIEITDKNIKSFERVARRYNVDFALKKDNTETPPRYLVFFKGRDVDVINQAFKEYAYKQTRHKAQPSLLKQLSEMKEAVKNMVSQNKVRKKDRGQEL